MSRIGRRLSSWDCRPSHAQETILNPEDLVRIRLRGRKFDLPVSQLLKFPDTKLGRLARHYQELGHTDVDYFFNRDPTVFQHVIQYYETGKLHFPNEVCGAVYKEELEFWQLDCPIEPCCTSRYQISLKQTEAIKSFENAIRTEQQLVKDYVFLECQRSRFTRAKAWYFLNYPLTSTPGKIYAALLYIAVLLYMAVLMVEDGDLSKALDDIDDQYRQNGSYTEDDIKYMVCQALTKGYVFKMLQKGLDGWMQAFDLGMSVFFLLDGCLHLITAPSIGFALTSFRVVIEVISQLPTIVNIAYFEITCVLKVCNVDVAEWFSIFWFMKFFRGLHFYVLVRHYMPTRVLLFVLKRNWREIMSIFLFVFMFTCTMGVIIYVADRVGNGSPQNYMFPNMFQCFWWVIITMTTVGYGDIVPSSFFGKVVGGLCALSGILLMALTVPLVSTYFQAIHSFSSKVDMTYLNSAPQPMRRSSKKERYGKERGSGRETFIDDGVTGDSMVMS
ncbi:potassium voltage-gated channel subfamily C member 3-like [Lineus longissimus]|uniref:potassium voltage-gated channel subfamily C member 3-like n=1 Tax=Lineus longissimus TaxID=88925 RepID=UPI002B4DC5D8